MLQTSAQLMFTWILGLIGDDAADKVRLGAAEVSHQLIKILLQVITQKQAELKTFCVLHITHS